MKITNLKFYAATLLMGGSIVYSNVQMKEMEASFEERINEYAAQQQLLCQKYDDLQVQLEDFQQEVGKTSHQLDLLLAKQQEKRQTNYADEVGIVENDNRINSIAIDQKEDGQYLLNFYKVGVQPYEYMVTTDIDSTLSSIDATYIDDIDTVFLDGCEDKKVLDALKYFKNLRRLNLDECTFADVSKISKLGALEYLRIADCPNVSDISSFKNLSNLRVIILNGTEVENIESLSYLSNLEVVDLKGNKIVNPCCLECLPRLYNLILTDNCITDMYYLNGLIHNNIISDMDAEEILNSYASTRFKTGTI